MFKRRPLLFFYATLLFVCLYFPLVALAISSFRGGPTYHHWYQRAFSDPQLLFALRNSVIIGLGTTLFSTLHRNCDSCLSVFNLATQRGGVR